MQKIKILNKFISENDAPFIVAEMSGNHNQSLERALQIVDAAAEAGADAIKLQTYTADTMTLDIKDREFFNDNPSSPWYGKSLYELYELAHTPWEWHKEIFQRCKQRGLICFSSPFDATAVDFLESLDTPCYKIASFENTDLELVKKVAATHKPIIISTGLATLADIDEVVRTAREYGCKELILLKCTSSYPAPEAQCNIRCIPHMQDMFDCHVGLSDHTLGIGVAVASVALGAKMIEKHLTLSRQEGGVDADFSLEPAEMKQLVEESKRAWRSLGAVNYGIMDCEKDSLMFKRSLYVVKDLKQGDKLTVDNVRAIRPGYGLAIRYYESILGKKINKDVAKGTAMEWSLLRG